jgi:hypothetical protein
MGPDPSWAGRVTFVQMLFGAPLANAVFICGLWFLLAAILGMLWLILWRGRRGRRPESWR